MSEFDFLLTYKLADDDDDDDADDDDDDDDDDDADDAADDDDDDDDDNGDTDEDADERKPGAGAAVGAAAIGAAAGAAAGAGGAKAYGRSGPSRDKDQFAKFEPSGDADDLPTNISYEYLFFPIENQGQTPCCVTFAVTSIVEALIHKHTGEHFAISKRALYSLAKHKYEPDQLNEDGLADDSALSVLRDIGHVLEDDLPFGTPTMKDLLSLVPDSIIRRTHDLSGFMRVENDAEHMMAALHEHGPLVVGMKWYKDWEDRVGDDGIMPDDLTEGIDGGHCIAIVGYSKTKNAFRLRNSWGTDWGDNGYAFLPMDMVEHIDDVYTLKL